MRKLFFSFAGLTATICLLSGCTATRSIITEYDTEGKVVKKTESSESVIHTVTKSTQNKSVVMWEDGWAAYISVSSGTVEDPSPHGKIFAGKVNKGAISILPNQTGLSGIARIVQSTKSDLDVSLVDGVNTSSSEIQQSSGKNEQSK